MGGEFKRKTKLIKIKLSQTLKGWRNQKRLFIRLQDGTESASSYYWFALTWVFLRAAQGSFWLNFKVLNSLMDLSLPGSIQKA